ncbi:MAG: hypothetical protein HFF13_06605 [Angelakisella sp.]|nr:hypothetical protein [Angelakisella sp.]
MDQIKATLYSKTDPALGSVTIQFPIHRKEYDQVLEQLESLGIGSPLDQDCQIETLDSHYPILKRLEETLVNLDELDYLAKRLDNIDEKATTFQGAAAAEGITSIQDFINLTFCYKQVSVVRDFRDLENIGRDHIITTQGRGSSDEEWAAMDFHAVAMDLLQNGDGKITPYGVVYSNGMKLHPLYTGGPFPAYGCGEPLVVAFKPQEGSEENFLFLPMAESRLYRVLERSGVIDPKNFELCYIDQAPMEEIISSLSLEKEDIFMLNRLAAALEDISPAEMEKLKAAVYLTEPDTSEKFLALMKKVEQLDDALRPLSTGPSTLRLYMPLTAEFTEDGYDYEEPEHLEGGELYQYAEQIAKALEDYRMPEEAERGIMHWYHEEDSVNEKVRSVVFRLEKRDFQLWGVAECQLLRGLTTKEMDTLKQYITGQASDGWGEGFEQRDIGVDEGVLNVHLWNSGDWSLQTEEERFSQQQKMGGM